MGSCCRHTRGLEFAWAANSCLRMNKVPNSAHMAERVAQWGEVKRNLYTKIFILVVPIVLNVPTSFNK